MLLKWQEKQTNQITLMSGFWHPPLGKSSTKALGPSLSFAPPTWNPLSSALALHPHVRRTGGLPRTSQATSQVAKRMSQAAPKQKAPCHVPISVTSQSLGIVLLHPTPPPKTTVACLDYPPKPGGSRPAHSIHYWGVSSAQPPPHTHRSSAHPTWMSEHTHFTGAQILLFYHRRFKMSWHFWLLKNIVVSYMLWSTKTPRFHILVWWREDWVGSSKFSPLVPASAWQYWPQIVTPPQPNYNCGPLAPGEREVPQHFGNLKLLVFQVTSQKCAPLQGSAGLALRGLEVHSAVVRPHLTVLCGLMLPLPPGHGRSSSRCR